MSGVDVTSAGTFEIMLRHCQLIRACGQKATGSSDRSPRLLATVIDAVVLPTSDFVSWLTRQSLLRLIPIIGVAKGSTPLAGLMRDHLGFI